VRLKRVADGSWKRSLQKDEAGTAWCWGIHSEKPNKKKHVENGVNMSTRNKGGVGGGPVAGWG